MSAYDAGEILGGVPGIFLIAAIIGTVVGFVRLRWVPSRGLSVREAWRAAEHRLRQHYFEIFALPSGFALSILALTLILE